MSQPKYKMLGFSRMRALIAAYFVVVLSVLAVAPDGAAQTAEESDVAVLDHILNKTFPRGWAPEDLSQLRAVRDHCRAEPSRSLPALLEGLHKLNAAERGFAERKQGALLEYSVDHKRDLLLKTNVMFVVAGCYTAGSPEQRKQTLAEFSESLTAVTVAADMDSYVSWAVFSIGPDAMPIALTWAASEDDRARCHTQSSLNSVGEKAKSGPPKLDCHASRAQQQIRLQNWVRWWESRNDKAALLQTPSFIDEGKTTNY